jgi:cyanophycinase
VGSELDLGRVRAVSQRLQGGGKRANRPAGPLARLCAMRGPVALVGAGEFLPAMLEFDRALLAATGRDRPRVAILPTASWPDGEDVFQRWAAMGVAHFTSLGAEVEPVLVRHRADAADPAASQAIGEADLVYLSGGKPGHALETIAGTPIGRALRDANARGATLAGCSAGAMALAGHSFWFRVRLLPWPLRWRPGLGFVPGATVVPHYDAWPEPLSALVALQSPRGSVVLGIDEDTGVVGVDGAWQVSGRSRVTVWRGRHRERYRAGDTFRL